MTNTTQTDDRELLGQEIILRVKTTPSGVKVDALDGYGLREGLFTKSRPRYFYGDEAEDKANEYAERRAKLLIEEQGKAVRVQKLGERNSHSVAVNTSDKSSNHT